MANRRLIINKEDGLVHSYEYVYGGCYADCGQYKPNGNPLAPDPVTGQIDEVRSDFSRRNWEKIKIFNSNGKILRVGRGGLIEEVEETLFWR